MTCTLPRQGLYAPNGPPPPPAPLISHNHHIQVQKALSGTVSCTNRAYARDTSRGLRVLCTSPAYARDRLVRDRRLQNSGFYTRQACAQVRLMHATLRYTIFSLIEVRAFYFFRICFYPCIYRRCAFVGDCAIIVSGTFPEYHGLPVSLHQHPTEHKWEMFDYSWHVLM